MSAAKYKPTGRWLFERKAAYKRGRILPGPSKPAPEIKRVVIDFSEHTVRELIACVDASGRAEHLTRIARKMLVEALVRAPNATTPRQRGMGRP